jgi:hypothetical protein
VAYDQVILIPGGGGLGGGARDVLDLFNYPESWGVAPDDPRWRGWTTGRLSVAKRLTEASVGYDVEPGVTAAIQTLEYGGATVTLQRVVSSGQGGPRRRGWSKLTKDYRDRLNRKGVTREAWEQGADLRYPRGHAPKPPRGAADYQITMRYLTDVQSRDDAVQRTLREFNTTARRPGWIPGGLSDDIVAALSQLRGTPSRWAAVRFVPAPNLEPWAMIVTFR